MYHGDHFEMKKQHRNLLTQHRLYLLHNLRPGEEMWSSLLAKGVLSQEMLEEIKVNGTANQQVSALLTVLPARGPTAFDDFCETLLECDHSHVAEYIKTVEATEQFREDIKRQMDMSEVSDNVLEKFVSVFKKATPAMQRFAERKFEVLMEEHESDMKDQETELEELDNKNTKLQLEVDQLKGVLKSCVEISESIASEVQESIPSKHFLSEEVTQLENLKKEVEKSSGNEQACTFYGSMATIVKYIEQHADIIITSTKNKKMRREKSCIQLDRSSHMSLIDKVLNLSAGISRYIEEISAYPEISSEAIGAELNKICSYSQHMANDVTLIKNNFSHLMKQKKKTDAEILSLLHNFQEIRRLERELKERKNHIADLNKHGQLMKKKMGRNHKREMEQIQVNLNQQKLQLENVQKALETQVNSADQRLRQMCELLPDHEESESNTDTFSVSCSTPGTEDARSLSATFPRRRMNGEPYLLTSPRVTPPATAISMDTSDEAQIKSSRSVISIDKTVKKEVMRTSNNQNKPPEEVVKTNSGVMSKPAKVEEKPRIVAKKEEPEDQMDKTEPVKRVGQPYKAKVILPRERPQRNIIASRRLPIKPEKPKPVEIKAKLPDKESNVSESGDSGLVLKEGSESLNNVSIEPTVKIPAKRQHESSSSGSESHPSSADSTSRKRPTEDSTLNKKPQDNIKPKIEEASIKISDTRDKTGSVAEVRTVNPKPKHNTVTARQSEELPTRPRPRYQRMSTQNMGASRPPPPPTGMGREEFFKYIRQQQQAAELPDQPLVIGRLHKAAGRLGHTGLEIPMSTPTQANRPPAGIQSLISREDSNDPTSNRRPGYRQALSTKRVEPAFKLPNHR